MLFSAVNDSRLVPAPATNLLLERDAEKLPVLECRHLGIDFGGLSAVSDFNIALGPTEISGLIGPNGAGKTTIFNLLTKVYEPTCGTVFINGKDTAGMTTAQLSHAGIARTFQNIRLFKNMSVEDNIKVAMDKSIRCNLAQTMLRLPRYWKAEAEAHERALDLLALFDLEGHRDEKAGSLPYGAQRKLEIVRALATDPKVLLLDEPAAGMNPSETGELMENIRRIRDEFSIAVLLIEHDMNLVMNICDGIAVINFGKIIAKGTPKQIQNDPAVIEAYLGRKAAEK